MKKFSFSSDAYVTAASMNNGTAIFGFGDGRISVLRPPYEKLKIHHVSEGVIGAVSPRHGGFLFGDQEGQVYMISEDDSISKIHQFQDQWIDHIEVSPNFNLNAIVAGKTVALWNGSKLDQFSDHPSTVSGVAFSREGNQIAAAHYNGVTIRSPDKNLPINKYVWKGSHISIIWSPDMKYILTGTQEKNLHVFDLENKQHLSMSGYSAKIKSLSWNPKGDTLFTSGSTQVPAWNFSRTGPAGLQPLLFGPNFDALVTQVAHHPRDNVLVAGYDNGVLLLIDTETGEHMSLLQEDEDVITCCQWDAKLDSLLYGTKSGSYGIIAC
jgi:WD40 repeat protein